MEIIGSGFEIESGSFFIPIASDGTVAQPICRMRPMTGAADLAYDDRRPAPCEPCLGTTWIL